jgi:hypothetical protein
LLNRHWGEQIVFERDNSIRIAMVCWTGNKRRVLGARFSTGSEEWSADGFTPIAGP